MRTILLTLIALLTTYMVNSQTVVFQEDFEGTTLKVTSTSALNNNNWAISTALHSQGSKSDTATVALSDTTYLTTDSFNCSSYYYVMLEFDQIAKLEINDYGQIEVSGDGGNTWVT